MEINKTPGKKTLKPSVVHDDLIEVKKPEYFRKLPLDRESTLPENPERNYHHEEFWLPCSMNDELKHADDDIWNGEDA